MTSAITNKVSILPVEQLKEMATILNDDFRDGADLVFDSVINQLEVLMPSTEFISFCDSL